MPHLLSVLEGSEPAPQFPGTPTTVGWVRGGWAPVGLRGSLARCLGVL